MVKCGTAGVDANLHIYRTPARGQPPQATARSDDNDYGRGLLSIRQKTVHCRCHTPILIFMADCRARAKRA